MPNLIKKSLTVSTVGPKDPVLPTLTFTVLDKYYSV